MMTQELKNKLQLLMNYGISAKIIAKYSNIGYRTLTNFLNGYRESLNEDTIQKITLGAKKISQEIGELSKIF